MAIDRHDQIEKLAYALWEGRGRPQGSPEIDWLAAEAHFHRIEAMQPTTRGLQHPDSAALPTAINTDELFNDEDTPLSLTPALSGDDAN
jgi:hypothetical protein